MLADQVAQPALNQCNETIADFFNRYQNCTFTVSIPGTHELHCQPLVGRWVGLKMDSSFNGALEITCVLNGEGEDVRYVIPAVEACDVSGPNMRLLCARGIQRNFRYVDAYTNARQEWSRQSGRWFGSGPRLFP